MGCANLSANHHRELQRLPTRNCNPKSTKSYPENKQLNLTTPKWRWKNVYKLPARWALVAASFPSVSMLPLLISQATWPSSIQRWSRCYSDAWRPHLPCKTAQFRGEDYPSTPWKKTHQAYAHLIHLPNSQLESLTWDEVAIRFAHPCFLSSKSSSLLRFRALSSADTPCRTASWKEERSKSWPVNDMRFLEGHCLDIPLMTSSK